MGRLWGSTETEVTQRLYPAFHKVRPLQHSIIPFGTAAINEKTLTGGTTTLAIDTVNLFNGQPTSKCTVSVGGSAAYVEIGVSTAAVSLSAEVQNINSRAILCAVKVGAGNTFSNATLYLGDVSWANFHSYNLREVGRVGDWILLSKDNLGPGSTTGTPNLAVAVRAKLRVYCTANIAPGDIWVGGAYTLPLTTPSVVLSIDDGYAECAWLADEAAKRGLPVTFNIVRDKIGAAGYLTTAQLLGIINHASGLHEVTNHTATHLTYTAGVNLAEYVADVVACRDYLAGLGVPYASASLHSYPSGNNDAALRTALAAVGFTSCRGVGTFQKYSHDTPIAMSGKSNTELYGIPCVCSLGDTTNLTTAQSQITSAAAAGTAWVLGHSFAAAASTYGWIKGYDSNYGVLNLLDWLAKQRDESGWEVVTWSEWYARLFTTTKAGVLL